MGLRSGAADRAEAEARSRSSDRDPGPAPAWALGICLLAGVVTPAAVSLAGQARSFDWLWAWAPLPPAKVASALGASFTAALLLLILSRVSGSWDLHSDARARWAKRLGFALLVGAVGLLCLHFRVYASSEDSWIWRMWAHDPFIMASEPLGRWSHYLAYQLVTLLDIDRWIDITPDRNGFALMLASAAAGMFAAGSMLGLAPGALPNSSRWSSVAFLLVTPTAILFCGFMEVTPWCYAFTSAYLLAGLRYLALDLRRLPWTESLLLMFAVWSHGSACFVTGAHAFLCLHWFRAKHDAESPWRAARLAQLGTLCLLPFSALAATLLYSYVFGPGRPNLTWYGNVMGGVDGVLFVPFSSEAQHSPRHQVFGSASYWISRLNLVLFACPLLMLAPLAAAQSLRARRPETLFLCAGLAGLLLLALLFSPIVPGGVLADFDVMAGFAVPATLLVALWWDARFSAPQRELLHLSCAVAAFSFLMLLRIRFP